MTTDEEYRESIKKAWLLQTIVKGDPKLREQWWDTRPPIVARYLIEALREAVDTTNEYEQERAALAVRAMYAEMEMGFDHWRDRVTGNRTFNQGMSGPRDLAKAACGVAKLWELCPEAAQYDDEQIWTRYAGNASGISHELRQLYSSAFSQLYLSGISRWWLCGLPTIVPGAKLAASLLATDLPDDVRPSVKPPWPVFVITVPEGLIQMQIPGYAGPSDVKIIHAFNILGQGQWKCGYFAMSESSDVCLNSTSRSWDKVLDNISHFTITTEENGEPTWRVAIGLDEICSPIDERAHSLIRRLIAGCILSLSDPARVDRPIVRVTREAPPAGAIGDPENPKLAVYRLGGAVRVDLRKEIKEYSMGVRKDIPHARTLVRGHWKRQAIGKRHQDHKIMHIEPYWRGDVPLGAIEPREFIPSEA